MTISEWYYFLLVKKKKYFYGCILLSDMLKRFLFPAVWLWVWIFVFHQPVVAQVMKISDDDYLSMVKTGVEASSSADSLFARYVLSLRRFSERDQTRTIRQLMDCASRYPAYYEQWMRLCHNRLYEEADSVCYDAVYLEILRRALAASLLSAASKERCRYFERLLQQHAPGSTLRDFVVNLREGGEARLHRLLERKPAVLFFFDPSCIRCQLLMSRLRCEKTLLRAVNEGEVLMFAVCVSEDFPFWETIKNDFPSSWRVALLSESEHRSGANAYIFDRFPMLLLVDAKQRVLLKNPTLYELMQRLNRSK